jgi:hypothetical protein
MGWGKRQLTVGTRFLTASCCNTNGSVTVLVTCIAASTSRDAAESLLPVIISRHE